MAQTTNSKKRISIIVAMDRKGLIGKGNALPWHLPADLKHFKRITMGKPIIMGRKTHESIGKALPGRTNIVVSGDPNYRAQDCIVANSLDAAIAAAGPVDEVIVIGGAALYQLALDRTDRIYSTTIHAELSGDTWFPPLQKSDWVVIERSEHNADEKNPYGYTFETLERVE